MQDFYFGITLPGWCFIKIRRFIFLSFLKKPQISGNPDNREKNTNASMAKKNCTFIKSEYKSGLRGPQKLWKSFKADSIELEHGFTLLFSAVFFSTVLCHNNLYSIIQKYNH